jgi:gamma-glutamylcyclotransferase (GGCT)/AIG2-like uncharacterized protein YtfP
MSGHLFVYGTLRSDCSDIALAAPGAEARALVRESADLLGSGRIAGRLFAVSWYPALVPGRGSVLGEVWRLPERERLFRALDAYEGEAYRCEPCHPRMGDGRLVRAVVWRYVAAIGDAPRIDSGDYRLWAVSQEAG